MIGATFLELVRTADPNTGQWLRRTTAWIVLQIADEVLETGDYDREMAARARLNIESMPHVTLRQHLRRILNIATGAEYVRRDWRSVLARRLLDYALFVRSIAHFAPAADIYGLVAETLDLPPRLRMEAYQGRAWAFRQLGQHDNADLIYDEMRALAESVGAADMVLEADLGHAKVLVERGDLPQAEAMALAVLQGARRNGWSRVVGRAHMDLACIAGIRKRYDDAIIHTDAAMAGPLSNVDRDICGMNQAWAYRKIRQCAEAAAFARTVVRDARGIEERIAARITLYHLAMDEGLDTTAQREELLNEERMSALRRSELYEATARDAWLSDDLDTAQREIEEGIRFAESCPNRLNRMVIRLAVALDEMNAGRMPKIFLSPNAMTRPDNDSALKRIGDDARRAECEAWNDSLTDVAAAGGPSTVVLRALRRVVVARG